VSSRLGESAAPQQRPHDPRPPPARSEVIMTVGVLRLLPNIQYSGTYTLLPNIQYSGLESVLDPHPVATESHSKAVCTYAVAGTVVALRTWTSDASLRHPRCILTQHAVNRRVSGACWSTLQGVDGVRLPCLTASHGCSAAAMPFAASDLPAALRPIAAKPCACVHQDVRRSMQLTRHSPCQAIPAVH
jgi:hypothetical protein